MRSACSFVMLMALASATRADVSATVPSATTPLETMMQFQALIRAGDRDGVLAMMIDPDSPERARRLDYFFNNPKRAAAVVTPMEELIDGDVATVVNRQVMQSGKAMFVCAPMVKIDGIWRVYFSLDNTPAVTASQREHARQLMHDKAMPRAQAMNKVGIAATQPATAASE